MSKTIFCDIDGVLLNFTEEFDYSINHAKPLVGAAEKLMEWHQKGYTIILVTGRPEPFRQRTMDQLQRFGIIYNQLVMNVGCGQRYLINDEDPDFCNDVGPRPKAISINLQRNVGLRNVDLDEQEYIFVDGGSLDG